MNKDRKQRQTLVVDGEEFDVAERPGRPGTYDVTWLTGPHPGYGFSSAVHPSGPVGAPEFEASIRNFMKQVDPSTGRIE